MARYFVEEVAQILAVDDRQANLHALTATLKSSRYQVVTALSGREALEKMQTGEYAVILLDVQMPVLDGFQTAEMIKENADWRHVPIIFITSAGNDEMFTSRGYQSGAVDFINKPFDPSILRSKVDVFVDLFLKTKEIKRQALLIQESQERERHQRLLELELENLNRYRNLANAIPCIVWRSRADGSLDYVNRHWTDYTGFPLEKSVGDGWHAAIEQDDLRDFLKSWLDSMLSGMSFKTECRIRCGLTGEMRWHLVRAVSESDVDGSIRAWLGTAVDIHDHKQWEARLAKAKAAADCANQAKSRFLANMSHEIRTPLNAIMGFSELLVDETDAEAKRESFAIIRRNGEHLLTIINELLDLSKIEAGKMRLEIAPVSIPGLMEELETCLAEKAEKKGLKIQFLCVNPIPVTVNTDVTRYRQILSNVIENAIKFTSFGEVKVEVSYNEGSLERKPSLAVHVTDTGIGMTDDQAATLFAPFTQVDTSASRKFGGTGLGLALSRRFAIALGGDVKVVSCRENGGCTVEVTIATNHESGEKVRFTDQLKDFNTTTRFQLKPTCPTAILGGRAILVVEDSVDSQNLIARYLKRAGANFEIAQNGGEAIEKACEREFDIILMDMQLPGIDGYRATKTLRQRGYDRPVIAITAHAFPEDRERCFASGCNAHVAKPIDEKRLVNSIIDELRKNQAHFALC